MNRIKRVYFPFISAGMQESTTYRTNFVFWILGEIMATFINYFLWKAVFDSSGEGTFMGFTMPEMVTYIFVNFMLRFMTESGSVQVIGEEIREGSITTRLIRPVRFEMPILFQELGNKILTMSLVFVPVLVGIEIYRFSATGSVQFQIGWFLLFILSMVISYLINFYFNLCFGFLAFAVKYMWGLDLVKGSIVAFLSGSFIPLNFLPSGLSAVLQYLPFASLAYTPVMIYMGKFDAPTTLMKLALQVVWLVTFILFTNFIWRLVSKRLTIQGG